MIDEFYLFKELYSLYVLSVILLFIILIGGIIYSEVFVSNGYERIIFVSNVVITCLSISIIIFVSAFVLPIGISLFKKFFGVC